MTDHRFQIGQAVRFTQNSFGRVTDHGVFRVEQLLPMTGEEVQYRISAEGQPAERVVVESELSDPAA
ncbi:MAG: hypothetical protein AB7G39_08410 [Alphaproteobacteria bacterium]